MDFFVGLTELATINFGTVIWDHERKIHMGPNASSPWLKISFFLDLLGIRIPSLFLCFLNEPNLTSF